MSEVQTREIDWEAEVRAKEPRPTTEVAYEFSNGRKFTEPFDPEGRGIYDDE